MTTVAYKAGIMACDSCWTYGDAVDTLSTKIARLKSGALLGMGGCNDSRQFIELLDNVKTFKQLPKYKELIEIRASFIGLLVLPSKEIVKICTTALAQTDENSTELGIWPIEDGYAAIGSGADFAIGALDYGASARQAVKIACRRDINSRLPVRQVTLETKSVTGG